jgi:hypothetical protein
MAGKFYKFALLTFKIYAQIYTVFVILCYEEFLFYFKSALHKGAKDNLACDICNIVENNSLKK